MFGVTVFVSDEMPAGTEMILVGADQLAVEPGRVELASTTQAGARPAEINLKPTTLR
jgi:hypothetical protein